MTRIGKYSSMIRFTSTPLRAHDSGSPVQRKNGILPISMPDILIVRTKINQKFALIRRADKFLEISCGQKSSDFGTLGSVI